MGIYQCTCVCRKKQPPTSQQEVIICLFCLMTFRAFVISFSDWSRGYSTTVKSLFHKFIAVFVPCVFVVECKSATAYELLANNLFFLNPIMLTLFRCRFRIRNRFLRNRFPVIFHRYLTTQKKQITRL